MGNPKVKKLVSVSAIFTQFCMVFVVALIASNIFETKEIASGAFQVTGGLLLFPICYIISDCVCEIWGFRKSWALISAGFVLNFLFIGMAALVDALPGADTCTNQEGFHAIFGFSARITLASCVAFLVGGYLNILVLDKMKKRSGENRLGLRLIVSSVAGEAADSLIFFPPGPDGCPTLPFHPGHDARAVHPEDPVRGYLPASHPAHHPKTQGPRNRYLQLRVGVVHRKDRGGALPDQVFSCKTPR